MVSGNHQLLVKPLAASWVPESHCCHPSGTYMSLEDERSDAQHGVRAQLVLALQVKDWVIRHVTAFLK